MPRNRSNGSGATSTVGRLESITANGVDSYYGYTKMLWLRDERPEVWQRTRSFLPPNSWINARL